MGKKFLSLCLCACLLVLGGCTKTELSAPPPSSAPASSQVSEAAPEEEAVTLTPEEIEKANEAFAPVRYGDNTRYASEISCFFTSEYTDVRDLDFEEFLRYCPAQTMPGCHEAEEYDDVLAAAREGEYPGLEGYEDILGMGMGSPPAAADTIIPVHRFKKEEISALLKKYAGITVDDLKDTSKVVYLEKYDCFYNFTSDFGPGTFQCEKGWKEGNKLRFVSEEYGKELVIEKAGEDYFIRSFTALKGEKS